MEIMMESIKVEDSANILCVILQILPQGLFLIYIGNSHMKVLKQNFIYIFTRTRSRERWLRGVIIKILSYIVLYESIYALVAFLIDILIKDKNTMTISRILLLYIIQIMQMLMFVLFSVFLMLFFSEIVCYFGTILMLGLPIIIDGVLYQNDQPWSMAVELIPFNFGNYNYLNSDYTNIRIIFKIFTLCIILYSFSVRRLNKYELV